jgi:hypothetical protein
VMSWEERGEDGASDAELVHAGDGFGAAVAGKVGAEDGSGAGEEGD